MPEAISRFRQSRYGISCHDSEFDACRLAGNNDSCIVCGSHVCIKCNNEFDIHSFYYGFYCKIDKHANDKKLVRVGRIVSVIVIVIAALWAPQIGKFGSILKYYQEMLAYLAPPIVAAFIVGIFSRRVNGQGVFFGLMSGFVIAVLLLFFKTSIFGDMHFLFIVPILFVFSILVMYLMSLCSAAPLSDKLNQNIFTLDFYRKETVELSKIKMVF